MNSFVHNLVFISVLEISATHGEGKEPMLHFPTGREQIITQKFSILCQLLNHGRLPLTWSDYGSALTIRHNRLSAPDASSIVHSGGSEISERKRFPPVGSLLHNPRYHCPPQTPYLNVQLCHQRPGRGGVHGPSLCSLQLTEKSCHLLSCLLPPSPFSSHHTPSILTTPGFPVGYFIPSFHVPVLLCLRARHGMTGISSGRGMYMPMFAPPWWHLP